MICRSASPGPSIKLTVKLGPSQLSEAEQTTAAEAIKKATTKEGQTMSQNHFTLSFPLQSPRTPRRSRSGFHNGAATVPGGGYDRPRFTTRASRC